jgi:predicted DNA-binding protein
MVKKNRTLTFSLPPELARKIRRAAHVEGRTVSNFLRRLIIKILEDWPENYIAQKDLPQTNQQPTNIISCGCYV